MGILQNFHEIKSSMLVQKERESLQKPLNKFLVSRNCTGNKIAILRPPSPMISKSDALLLAALLVREADTSPDLGAFKSMLTSVSQPD